MNQNDKISILLGVLKELHEIGAKVISLCCDGQSSNIPLLECLGASFDSDNVKPYILNPFDGSEICVLLDPCHMTKLIRNALGELKTIFDPKAGNIKWAFFERLVRAKYAYNMLTPKLTKNI